MTERFLSFLFVMLSNKLNTHKSFFFSILKSNIFALDESEIMKDIVLARIKSLRYCIQICTKNNNSEVLPLRRALYRWKIKANPLLIKNCVDKIAIQHHIQKETAIWRIMKMMEKLQNMKNKKYFGQILKLNKILNLIIHKREILDKNYVIYTLFILSEKEKKEKIDEINKNFFAIIQEKFSSPTLNAFEKVLSKNPKRFFIEKLFLSLNKKVSISFHRLFTNYKRYRLYILYGMNNIITSKMTKNFKVLVNTVQNPKKKIANLLEENWKIILRKYFENLQKKSRLKLHINLCLENLISRVEQKAPILIKGDIFNMIKKNNEKFEKIKNLAEKIILLMKNNYYKHSKKFFLKLKKNKFQKKALSKIKFLEILRNCSENKKSYCFFILKRFNQNEKRKKNMVNSCLVKCLNSKKFEAFLKLKKFKKSFNEKTLEKNLLENKLKFSNLLNQHLLAKISYCFRKIQQNNNIKKDIYLKTFNNIKQKYLLKKINILKMLIFHKNNKKRITINNQNGLKKIINFIKKKHNQIFLNTIEKLKNQKNFCELKEKALSNVFSNLEKKEKIITMNFLKKNKFDLNSLIDNLQKSEKLQKLLILKIFKNQTMKKNLVYEMLKINKKNKNEKIKSFFLFIYKNVEIKKKEIFEKLKNFNEKINHENEKELKTVNLFKIRDLILRKQKQFKKASFVKLLKININQRIKKSFFENFAKAYTKKIEDSLKIIKTFSQKTEIKTLRENLEEKEKLVSNFEQEKIPQLKNRIIKSVINKNLPNYYKNKIFSPYLKIFKKNNEDYIKAKMIVKKYFLKRIYNNLSDVLGSLKVNAKESRLYSFKYDLSVKKFVNLFEKIKNHKLKFGFWQMSRKLNLEKRKKYFLKHLVKNFEKKIFFVFATFKGFKEKCRAMEDSKKNSELICKGISLLSYIFKNKKKNLFGQFWEKIKNKIIQLKFIHLFFQNYEKKFISSIFKQLLNHSINCRNIENNQKELNKQKISFFNKLEKTQKLKKEKVIKNLKIFLLKKNIKNMTEKALINIIVKMKQKVINDLKRISIYYHNEKNTQKKKNIILKQLSEKNNLKLKYILKKLILNFENGNIKKRILSKLENNIQKKSLFVMNELKNNKEFEKNKIFLKNKSLNQLKNLFAKINTDNCKTAISLLNLNKTKMNYKSALLNSIFTNLRKRLQFTYISLKEFNNKINSQNLKRNKFINKKLVSSINLKMMKVFFKLKSHKDKKNETINLLQRLEMSGKAKLSRCLNILKQNKEDTKIKVLFAKIIINKIEECYRKKKIAVLKNLKDPFWEINQKSESIEYLNDILTHFIYLRKSNFFNILKKDIGKLSGDLFMILDKILLKRKKGIFMLINIAADLDLLKTIENTSIKRENISKNTIELKDNKSLFGRHQSLMEEIPEILSDGESLESQYIIKKETISLKQRENSFQKSNQIRVNDYNSRVEESIYTEDFEDNEKDPSINLYNNPEESCFESNEDFNLYESRSSVDSKKRKFKNQKNSMENLSSFDNGEERRTAQFQKKKSLQKLEENNEGIYSDDIGNKEEKVLKKKAEDEVDKVFHEELAENAAVENENNIKSEISLRELELTTLYIKENPEKLFYTKKLLKVYESKKNEKTKDLLAPCFYKLVYNAGKSVKNNLDQIHKLNNYLELSNSDMNKEKNKIKKNDLKMRNTKMREMIKNLENEIGDLEINNKGINGDIKILKNMKDIYNDKIKEKENIIKNLNEENRNLDQEKNEIIQKTEILEKEKNKMNIEKTKIIEEKNLIQKKIEDLMKEKNENSEKNDIKNNLLEKINELENKKRKIEDKLNDFNLDKEDLEEEMENLESEKNKYGREIQSLEEYKLNIEKQIESFLNEKKLISKEKKQTIQDNSIFEKNKAKIEKEIDLHNKNIEISENKIRELEEKKKNYNGRLIEIYAKRQILDCDNNNNNEANKLHNKEIKKYEKIIEDLEQTEKIFENEEENIGREISELQNLLKGRKEEKILLYEATEILKQNPEANKEKIDKNEKYLNDVKREIFEIESNIGVIQLKRETNLTKLKNTQENEKENLRRIEELTKEIEKNNEEIKKNENENNQLKSETEEITNNLKTVENDLEEKKKSLEVLKKEKSAKLEIVKDLNRQITKNNYIISSSEDLDLLSSTRYNQLEKDLNNVKEEIKLNLEVQNDVEEKIDIYKNDLLQLNDKIIKYSNDIEDNNNEIQITQNELKEKFGNDINEENDYNNLNNLFLEKNEYENQISKIDNDLKNKQFEIKKNYEILELKNQTKEKNLDSINDTLKEVGNNKNELTDFSMNIQKKSEVLLKNKNDIIKKKSMIKNQINNLQKNNLKIQKITQDLKNLEKEEENDLEGDKNQKFISQNNNYLIFSLLEKLLSKKIMNNIQKAFNDVKTTHSYGDFKKFKNNNNVMLKMEQNIKKRKKRLLCEKLGKIFCNKIRKFFEEFRLKTYLQNQTTYINSLYKWKIYHLQESFKEDYLRLDKYHRAFQKLSEVIILREQRFKNIFIRLICQTMTEKKKNKREKIMPILHRANKKYENTLRNVFWYWYEIRNENKWFLKIISNIITKTPLHPQIAMWRLKSYSPPHIFVSKNTNKALKFLNKFFKIKIKNLLKENFDALKNINFENKESIVVPRFSRVQTRFDDYGESTIKFSDDENDNSDHHIDIIKISRGEDIDKSKKSIDRKYTTIGRRPSKHDLLPNYHNYRSSKILNFQSNIKTNIISHKLDFFKKSKAIEFIKNQILKIKYVVFIKFIKLMSVQSSPKTNLDFYNNNIKMLMNENIECKKELRKKNSLIDGVKNDLMKKNKNLEFLRNKLIKSYFLNLQKLVKKYKFMNTQYFFIILKCK